MPDRDAARADLLAAAGWGNARILTLAGDASNRRYFRLHRPDGASAVLMDAPAERGEDVRPFLTVANHLSSLGLSAPRIMAADQTGGFLLLEDLGDDLYAQAIPKRPALELPLYETAIDVLLHIHAAGAPTDWPVYDVALMAKMSGLAAQWYAFREPEPFSAALEPVLATLPGDRALALRDYHAENLIWLPARQGTARVGLLDFQDAMLAHPAYDLVSLLEDARRDLGAEIAGHCLDRYVAASGADAREFRRAFALLGTQRNLRIIGVFARLARYYGKPRYIDMIPRVWAHLMGDLDHPYLSGLRGMVLDALPPPTAHHLQRLRTP